MTEIARLRLKAGEEYARQQGVPCKAVHLWESQPYRAIVDTAKKAGCDLVFMASHGRKGVEKLLIGSETTKVLTHARVPVLVWRE
jgi:nucleotide-binding universal stress UspA family protein